MAGRRRKHDYGDEPWYLRDFGGLPGWALVLAGATLAVLGVVIVSLLLR